MTATVPLIRYMCDHHECDTTAYTPADPGHPPARWVSTTIEGRYGLDRVRHLCPDHANALSEHLCGIPEDVS